jgi:hypothetical protein
MDENDKLDLFPKETAQVRAMLGDRTVAQFSELPLEYRTQIFHKHLGQHRLVDEERDGDNMGDSNSAKALLLRREAFMGDDKTGKQLVKEAREMYYRENRFFVRLRWLCKFKWDRLGGFCWGESETSIATLVNSLIVEINLHDDFDQDFPGFPNGKTAEGSKDYVPIQIGAERAARSTQERLEDLFLFTNAKEITLVLRGGGLLDGSDLKTHQKIADISLIVKRLLAYFGDRFKIEKQLDRQPYPTHSLRSYWDSPADSARRNVEMGEATTEQLMQVEIEDWTTMSPNLKLKTLV